jgi:predicted esterase
LSQERGDIASAALIRSYDEAQLAQVYADNGIPTFLAPINFEVDAWRIVYYTASATGDSLTLASGLLAIPQGTCDFPLFNYNHGTSYYGPSVSDLELEWQVGVVMAANGYLAALPDYLGYGATPLAHPHPYLHAASQASSIVDLLRATRQWCEDEDVSINDQLFLAGYSQGGHATMAAHRAIETLHSDEFTVTASAPGSGPYDLSGLTRDALLSEAPTRSFYLAFLMMSYQYVYGNLWNDPSEAFVAPFDSLLPLLYDRNSTLVPVPFPDTARNMLQPSYLQAVGQDSMHPANVALRDNDLYDWTPQAPVRMYYCEADEVVPYQNALLAQNRFTQNGATQVETFSAGANSGHEACAIPVFLNTKFWLDSFREACTLTESKLTLAAQLTLSSVPGRSAFVLRGPQAVLTQATRLRVLDLQGRTVHQVSLQARTRSGPWRVQVPGLAPGMYVVELEGPDFQWRSKWMM